MTIFLLKIAETLRTIITGNVIEAWRIRTQACQIERQPAAHPTYFAMREVPRHPFVPDTVVWNWYCHKMHSWTFSKSFVIVSSFALRRLSLSIAARLMCKVHCVVLEISTHPHGRFSIWIPPQPFWEFQFNFILSLWTLDIWDPQLPCNFQ